MSYDTLTYLRFYAALGASLSFAKSLHDRSGNILQCKMVRRQLTRRSVLDEHRAQGHVAHFLRRFHSLCRLL